MLVYIVAVKNFRIIMKQQGTYLSRSRVRTLSRVHIDLQSFWEMYSLVSVFQILTKDKKGFGF